MSHKTPKIEALLAGLDGSGIYERHYLGFFKCFNEQLYYDAHDVLEALWLPLSGQPQANYYQGLIQLAGAFVHLQKNRLGPAARLFALALKNFEPYPAHHAGIDLDHIRQLCRHQRDAILASGETLNPWSTEAPPQLAMPAR